MNTKKGRIVKEIPKLLWISDAVAHTGFATVSHGVLDHLYKKYDVHVLAVNYFGDPHDYPYKIYPAASGGDVYGIARLPKLLKAIRPHIVCIVNDPWVTKEYLKPLDTPLGKLENGTDVYTHKVAYMPVDSPNIQRAFAEPLNALDHSIFYTKFALDEMRKGGFTSEHVSIISHGINVDDFSPMDKKAARKKLQNLPDNWFVVGCVARNQPRKRLDLLIEYFAEFAKDKPENVKLYYHGALHDAGWNVIQLAEYYGIDDRIIITSPTLTSAVGVTKEQLRDIYGSFDFMAITTLGEGWGLPIMEGMACRRAQIVPKWSALAEWADGGVEYVPCTSTQANTNGLNTIGGIADKRLFVDALNKLYYDTEYRNKIADAGFQLVTQPKYTWHSVANAFDRVFTKVMYGSDTKT